MNNQEKRSEDANEGKCKPGKNTTPTPMWHKKQKTKERPATEQALEGVWDLRLLISRPKVYSRNP